MLKTEEGRENAGSDPEQQQDEQTEGGERGCQAVLPVP